MISTWTETYTVRSYDVGPDGLLTLAALANFLQDAAGAHARELDVAAEQLAEHRLSWFLARVRVVVNERPAWHEEVRIETWPSGHDALYATREFLVHSRNSLLARGTSAWLLVHLDRRRPVRLPDFVRDLPLPDRPKPLPKSPDRLPTLNEPDFVHIEKARRDDLDLNAHVNNVSYLTWVLEALAAAGEMAVPDEFHLQFRTEAAYGDVVQVRSKATPRGYLHRLVRENDDRDLALARTGFGTA